MSGRKHNSENDCKISAILGQVFLGALKGIGKARYEKHICNPLSSMAIASVPVFIFLLYGSALTFLLMDYDVKL